MPSKDDIPQELAPLHERDLDLVKTREVDVSDLMWLTRDTGYIKLRAMADSHLRNTALMLIGMGYQVYDASDELKVRWLTALRMEWEKRMRERRANFVRKTD